MASPGSKVMIVADAAVSNRYGKDLLKGLRRQGFEAELVVIASGEKSKTLAQAGKLFRVLALKRFERKSWLIALGGGVVGDLTGFVAASFLRGIPFIQVPTTLLAQVDASIGGKTGVDIPEGKNLVGAFYHPRLIWIDPKLLKSLPNVHWRNGLAEVIKYGAIRDEALFVLLEKNIETLIKGYSPAWEPIIARCAQIKAHVVKKDPLETAGLRAILNFGHSVGHAIEAATGYKAYLHGEAVSIGMFVAGFISQQLNLLDPLGRIRLGTLLTRAGLPSRVKAPITREKLKAFLSRDKKVEGGIVKFVVLTRLGHAVSGKAVSPELLDMALGASGL